MRIDLEIKVLGCKTCELFVVRKNLEIFGMNLDRRWYCGNVSGNFVCAFFREGTLLVCKHGIMFIDEYIF